MSETVINKVSTFRKELGVTQEELAQAAGVTRQTIIAIEKDKYSPSLEVAFKISNIFGMPLENVFNYE